MGQKLNIKKNVTYKGIVTRKKSLRLIAVSKYSLGNNLLLMKSYIWKSKFQNPLYLILINNFLYNGILIFLCK